VRLHRLQFASDVAQVDVELDDALLLVVDQKEVARTAAVIGAQPRGGSWRRARQLRKARYK
jgi:hypothetical protein